MIDGKGIIIVGGFDTDFNRVVGYSVLDGNRSIFHVVFATNVSGLGLYNLNN
ncbi:MAG: hypothetical protein N2712_07210 [Brevinematales bacterium]|nr:hypothetical protein [Brevinematales bacterium]